MKRYQIDIPEVHYLTMELDANSEKEAREQANAAVSAGLLEGYNIEYSHTSDPSEWLVTEMK